MNKYGEELMAELEVFDNRVMTFAKEIEKGLKDSDDVYINDLDAIVRAATEDFITTSMESFKCSIQLFALKSLRNAIRKRTLKD